MTGALANYLLVAAILFTLGAVGFLTRRNMIVMFLSVEMMLQGVALNFVAFGHHWGNYQGQSFTIFVLTVAACEAAIALGLILVLYQARHSLDVSQWTELRETAGEPLAELAAETLEPDEVPPPPPELPTLTPAGHEPRLPKRKVPTHV